MQHLAGYRFANGSIDDLTYNQELFVALVAEEELRLKVRLAGAKAPRARRHKSSTGKRDWYGELLKQHQQSKEMSEHDDELIEKYSKPSGWCHAR